MLSRRAWWTRTPVVVAATVLLVVLVWLASPVGWCSERRLSACHCGSTRWEDRRRLFSHDGLSIPFLADTDDLRPSIALAEVFEPGHVHAWDCMSSAMFKGLSGATYSGSARPPPLVRRHYETDAGFRAAIRAAVVAGRLTREDAAELLALGANPRIRRSSRDQDCALARRGMDALRAEDFDSKTDVHSYLARFVP